MIDQMSRIDDRSQRSQSSYMLLLALCSLWDILPLAVTHTFKLIHELVARLRVKARTDEGEDGQLLHLLFVGWGNIKVCYFTM